MKIRFKTFGCTANQADSDIMKKQLAEAGHDIVSDNGDLLIVNTCGVVSPTQNKILNYLSNLDEDRVIIAGCLGKMIDLSERFPEYSVIGPDQILDIPEVVDRVSKGEVIVELDSKEIDRLGQGTFDKVPIAQGCLGDCSYCSTKFARPKFESYEVDSILKCIRKGFKEGYRRFYLTAQDTGSYGKDIDSSLPKLLNSVSSLDLDFKVRVGMMNPRFVKDFADELVESYKSEKIIDFLHLPVQSGNDKVLEDMNRGYTVEDFRGIVKLFREEFPDMEISTDVICGFPGENREQFEDTLELIKEVRPDILNINKFYPRPGTKAKEMNGQLSTKEIKERSKEITEVFQKVKNIKES